MTFCKGFASHTPTHSSRNYTANSAEQIFFFDVQTQVPYTLNEQEVHGAVIIFADGVSKPVANSGVVDVSTIDFFFSTVFVFNADNVVAAQDVVAPGIKMTLEFNAENSARAEVVDALRLTALPLNELKGMYTLIDDHELFPELVAAYRQAPGIRDEGRVVRLGIQIAHSLEIEKSIQ